jgi:hypothetical protein
MTLKDVLKKVTPYFTANAVYEDFNVTSIPWLTSVVSLFRKFQRLYNDYKTNTGLRSKAYVNRLIEPMTLITEIETVSTSTANSLAAGLIPVPFPTRVEGLASEKRLEMSVVGGGLGKVYENYGREDYNFQITFDIVGVDETDFTEQKEVFDRIVKYNKPLRAINKVLNGEGIQYFIIKSYAIELIRETSYEKSFSATGNFTCVEYRDNIFDYYEPNEDEQIVDNVLSDNTIQEEATEYVNNMLGVKP